MGKTSCVRRFSGGRQWRSTVGVTGQRRHQLPPHRPRNAPTKHIQLLQRGLCSLAGKVPPSYRNPNSRLRFIQRAKRRFEPKPRITRTGAKTFRQVLRLHMKLNQLPITRWYGSFGSTIHYTPRRCDWWICGADATGHGRSSSCPMEATRE